MPPFPFRRQVAERRIFAQAADGAFGRDFIRDAARDPRPFCLSISFKAPHHPVTPDPVFDHVYAGMTFTKPGNFGRAHGAHFSEQSREGRQYARFEAWKYDRDYDGYAVFSTIFDRTIPWAQKREYLGQ